MNCIFCGQPVLKESSIQSEDGEVILHWECFFQAGKEIRQITRVSTLSGVAHTRAIMLTEAEWEAIQPFLHDDRLSAPPIQEVLPRHSADDREFILSGITPEEWDAWFKGLEDV